jgi:putative addiction module killer protein
MVDIVRYVTAAGRDVLGDWLTGLRDLRARARITVRLTRLAVGNFGDCRSVGNGVWELRIDYGPGYRVYYAMLDRTCVLLLCGGDKTRQSADIERAIEYWKDYRERTLS